MTKIDQISKRLASLLPDLAQKVINKNLDLAIPENKSFLNNPDDPSHHKPSWHQWGVITHTLMFEEIYQTVVQDYLHKWKVDEAINQHLSEKIDGVPKKELLSLSILLHDIGKFATRTLKQRQGKLKHNFINHEKASGRIIRSPLINPQLKELGLTDDQIEYIARTAELHYELGIVRNQVRNANNYSITFAKSKEARQQYWRVIGNYSSFAPEIGILFLADSLSKVGVWLAAESDKELEEYRKSVDSMIEAADFPENLKEAVIQLPISVAIAREYLRTWVEVGEKVSD